MALDEMQPGYDSVHEDLIRDLALLCWWLSPIPAGQLSTAAYGLLAAHFVDTGQAGLINSASHLEGCPGGLKLREELVSFPCLIYWGAQTKAGCIEVNRNGLTCPFERFVLANVITQCRF